MLATDDGIVTDLSQRREDDIALLKRIRQQTVELRELCQKYSYDLAAQSYPFLREVDAKLSACLLARELGQ